MGGADGAAPSTPSGARPGAASQADARLRLRLQAPDVLQQLLSDLPETECASGDELDRAFSPPDGIVTADDHKTEIDTLILATGYNIWDINFPAIEIIGRDGRDLGKWWRETRFQAYEGVGVPKFPNYLTLASPYSYSGLSYFTTIESQMRHIKRLFGELRRRGATTFEVTEVANREFLDRVTKKLTNSVFYVGRCETRAQLLLQPAR